MISFRYSLPVTEGQRSFVNIKEIEAKVKRVSDFLKVLIILCSHLTLTSNSSSMDNNTTFWYAVHTRPRWEKKVVSLLQNRGIENYCPLNKVIRQWSDRKKTILEPLFKGYVFVQVDEAIKWEMLAISGIVNYVYWLGKPARIRDHEIDTIRRFLHEFEDVEVTENVLQVNTNVQVKQGVMMNFRGIVLELQGNKAKVRINSMGIQLSAYFDKKNLEIV